MALALAIFKQIATEPEFRDWPHCGVVVQAYLRESPRDLESLTAWARSRSPSDSASRVKPESQPTNRPGTSAAGRGPAR